MKDNLRIAIIGAGLIGRKRAKALPAGIKLKIVCDVNLELAKSFAKEFNCSFTHNSQEIFSDPEINAVIIATPNGSLAELAVKSIEAGKNVLIEKPGGRTKKEIENIFNAWKKKKSVVFFGYNHRFHPAIAQAKEIVDSKQFGPVLFMRAKYGHGGRIGYEKEWRFKKELSGGGELVDQGSHLIDLTNFFIGSLAKVKSSINTFFWKTSLEDTAFMILENGKQTALLSVSAIEWKNLFCLEVMLEKAKLQIDGLGGSYGTEKLTVYKMKPEMGPPDMEGFVFDQLDISWESENKLFFEAIKNKDYSQEPFKQALYVFDIIEKVYAENKK